MKINYFKNGYQVKMQSTEDALGFHANEKKRKTISIHKKRISWNVKMETLFCSIPSLINLDNFQTFLCETQLRGNPNL
jgi:hypothetical protein